MNTPVSFEIAKLLKEKGFDLTPYLAIDNENPKNLNSNYNPREYQSWYFNLTIAEVVMWLYEKHEIWIEVVKPVRQKLFRFNVDNKDNINEFTSVVCFNSPTEAYKAGIEYTLNNLI
jgi:hypothetical protein